MDIAPDTKDWTWVLDEPCPECGFDASTVGLDEVGPRVVADLPRWVAALERDDARVRPAPTTWSVAEYACHVRDVFVIFGERARLMLDEDDPLFANWDQDETALADDYAAQDPAVVAGQLVASGHAAAATFASVPPGASGRTGRRSNGSTFTVLTLAQYFLHDVVHHLHDIDG